MIQLEQLGSGIPRILEFYSKNSFHFSENFLRVILPKTITENSSGNQDSNQESNQDSNQDVFGKTRTPENILKALKNILFKEEKLSEKTYHKYYEEANNLKELDIKVLDFCLSPKSRKEILEDCLGLSNQTKNFRINIEPLIESELITRTIQDRPTSKYQKYFTNKKGKAFLYIATHHE